MVVATSNQVPAASTLTLHLILIKEWLPEKGKQDSGQEKKDANKVAGATDALVQQVFVFFDTHVFLI